VQGAIFGVVRTPVVRTFETLILIALVPLIVGPAVWPLRRPGWLRVLAWTAVTLALLHLAVEGYRWQMVPAYALVVSSCFFARGRHGEVSQDSGPRTAVRLGHAALGMVAWAVALFLGFGNPIFHYPSPTGPYPVGTTPLYL
jgi:hypothetical protein